VEVVEVDWVESNIFADEILKLAGGDFAESFETRDFGAGAERIYRGLLLLLGVTIPGDLLVADAEERRLQDEEVIVPNDVGEELEEEREQQQADVHAVHVGVGGDDDLVVAQPVEPFLDIQRGLEEVKLLVLVDDFFREAVSVERFAFQREDGWCLHVARRGERAGGRVAFDDEERALLGAWVLVA